MGETPSFPPSFHAHLWVSAIVLTLLLSACKREGSSEDTGPLEPLPTSGLVGSLDTPASARVVSLLPSATELVFAVGAGDQLVARTQDCDAPSAARALPSVGSGLSPDLERLLTLEPDLIVLGEFQRNLEVLAPLRRRGVAVLVLPMKRLNDLQPSIALLGEHLGRRDEAAALSNALADALEAPDDVQPDPDLPQAPSYDDEELPPAEALERSGQRVQRLVGVSRGDPSAAMRTLIIVGHDPFYAAGPESFMHDLLLAAGGRNVLSRSDWMQLDAEAILTMSPAVLIDTTESGANIASWRFLGELGERMPHICSVEASLVSRLGPRTPEGIQAMRSCIEVARALQGGR